MVPFGQNVLLWRLHRGLTQAALAARARLPQPNLSAIENGRREVTLSTLRALALALDVSPGVLADGLSPERAAPLTREALERIAAAAAGGKTPADPDEQRLAEGLRALARTRLRALGAKAGARRLRRSPDAAWVRFASRLSPAELDSLVQRTVERARRSS